MHDHAAGHAHDHASHEDVLGRAERLCRERDLQFTRLRRDVLETIAAESKPMGAYDIAERLSGGGKRVAAVSVYRALDFLTEHGLVHRIASRNAFVSCGHDHGERDGLLFLICRSCGGIDELTSPAIESQLDRAVTEAGFTPTSRIIEVEGECGACRKRDGHTAR
ncbi:Fur family transcriptional regulator [Methylobacterium brachythecii]|uniref:Ferric uptake regulation protein n=1 Tax=Methylobacterium brachythecii TaxID=1176177 RepID=A0A7W6F6B4_9HYPH|nr:Fur family transcriptional regulator [Methylobacterium brachythecii]MBB3902180.1 Fur family zinc uptake transcriptional regulator [Methylobacterium brachythecii]